MVTMTDMEDSPRPGYSDAARRLADGVNVHVMFGTARGWLACRLADGASDGVVYDTRADAVRHQLHEQLCCYVELPLTQMTYREAEGYLSVHRKLYDGGMRPIDPERPDLEIVTPYLPEVTPWLTNPRLRRPRR